MEKFLGKAIPVRQHTWKAVRMPEELAGFIAEEAKKNRRSFPGQVLIFIEAGVRGLIEAREALERAEAEVTAEITAEEDMEARR